MQWLGPAAKVGLVATMYGLDQLQRLDPLRTHMRTIGIRGKGRAISRFEISEGRKMWQTYTMYFSMHSERDP